MIDIILKGFENSRRIEARTSKSKLELEQDRGKQVHYIEFFNFVVIKVRYHRILKQPALISKTWTHNLSRGNNLPIHTYITYNWVTSPSITQNRIQFYLSNQRKWLNLSKKRQ